MADYKRTESILTSQQLIATSQRRKSLYNHPLTIVLMTYLILLLLVWITLYQASSGEAQTIYYITPNSENRTCNARNGRSLIPCYQLDQLNNQRLSTISSLTLSFLPGTHTVSRSLVFRIRELTMKSFDESDDVEIDCDPLTFIRFEDIEELEVNSIEFHSCSLECNSDPDTISIVYLYRCVFADNRLNNAVSIDNAYFITVENCTFTLNYGALSLKQSINDFTNPVEFRIIRTTFVENRFGEYSVTIDDIYATAIRNSTFSSNKGAVLSMHREDRVGATSLLIINTLFLNNHREDNGGALSIKWVQLNMVGNHFINNTAKFGGAVYANQSIIKANNTLFQENYSAKSGSAFIMLLHKSASLQL